MKIALCVIGLITACHSSSLSAENRTLDLQYNLLLGCLISAGVNSDNIHHRNSGVAYDELNFQWNTLNGHVEPLAYLVASHVSDIQKAVTCCGLTKVRIVARSGGHSYMKNSFGDSRSLIVDLVNLNHVSVDPMKMTSEIGAGATLAQISYKLWKNGNFLIPLGFCPTVGIGGLALGGGYGRFTSVFGLTSDNIVEVEMVDARGELQFINNTTNSDLFWALRGGGGGNFGIVTKFKFKIYKAPSSVIFIQHHYSLENFSLFYSAWQKLLTFGVPRHMSFVFRIVDNQIKMGLSVYNFQYQNETVSSLTNFLNSFSFPNATVIKSTISSYDEILVRDANTFSPTIVQNISQLENFTKYDADVGWKKMRSIFVDRILSDSQISKLQDIITECLKQYGYFAGEPNGAAVNSLLPSDTAFVHRGTNLFLLQAVVFTPAHKQPDIQADRAMGMFFEKSKSIFHHRESYQNYMDQEMTDYLVRYYGSNLNRLISIKRRYDPGNVFHHPQSIPVSIDGK